MTTLATEEAVQTYQLDPAHSSARFSVRHMMISHVRGEFSKLSGTLQYNQANPAASTVEVEIDVTSIGTGNSDRDNHLRTSDFFEADKYPTITFVSTHVKQTGEATGTVTGNLTLRGVTKEVTLEVEGSLDEVKDPWGNWRRGFEASAKIKRSDFGLNYNAALETGGFLIGEDVNITLDVQFVRPGA